MRGKVNLKRMIISFITLIVALSIFPIPQSYAIFGLSACEKVQKQVISIEKNINSKLDYLKDFEGKVLRGKPLSVYNYVTHSKFMDKLWKIGYNNPKCFTNTQKLVIKKLPENSWKFPENIWPLLTYANSKHAYFTTGKCKDPLTQVPWGNCIRSTTYTLEFAKNWQSLYEY